MNSITVTTTVRSDKPISQAVISEIVQGIRQGLQLSVSENSTIGAEPQEPGQHKEDKN